MLTALCLLAWYHLSPSLEHITICSYFFNLIETIVKSIAMDCPVSLLNLDHEIFGKVSTAYEATSVIGISAKQQGQPC
jgi:hypothetical protein